MESYIIFNIAIIMVATGGISILSYSLWTGRDILAEWADEIL